MVKIKSVFIDGMHNANKVEYTFDNVNYIYGTNGSGKSTILQAIQLGLLGYIPGSDKTKSGVFEHSNGPVMIIKLVIDNNGKDVTITRIFTKSGSSVTSSLDISPKTDISSIISDVELPIFNFDEFVGLTANKLKDWFVSFLPKSEVKIDWKTVLESSCEDIYGPTKSAIIDESVRRISGFNLKGVDEIRTANEYFKSKVSFAKSSVERTQSTIQSLVYYDDVDTERSLDDVNAEIARYNELRDEYNRYVVTANKNDAIMTQLKTYRDCSAESFDKDKKYLEYLDKYNNCAARIEEHDVTAKTDECVSRIHDLAVETAEIDARLGEMKRIISSKGICPYFDNTCDNLISKVSEFEDKCKDLDASRVNKDAEIAALNEEIDRFRCEHVELVNEYNAWQLKMTNIKHNYQMRDSLRSQISEVERPDIDIIEIENKLVELKNIRDKINVNNHYSAVMESLAKDKLVAESELKIYKAWVNLTGVNGLQTSAGGNPFEVLQTEMDKKLKAMFGSKVKSQFILLEKANSFSFGLIRNDEYVPYKLLSSGEKCRFAITMMASLVSLSDTAAKIVIVDDMIDHLDKEGVKLLFESLSALPDIQFIFAAVNRLPSETGKSIKLKKIELK